MQKLLEGYQRFRETDWPDQRRLFESLAANGQRPRMLIIACVDSRVDPTRIFDAPPGELLVVRNVANLVPPYSPDVMYHGTSAALEFGVRVLNVPNIMVLGHGLCSGVRALLEGAPENARDFVEPWMSMARPAREYAKARQPPEEQQMACEHEVIRISLANLMTFPWIAEPVGTGELALHGAWFNIHTGVLTTMQPDGSFAPAV
jgi:carbonic anhydrase